VKVFPRCCAVTSRQRAGICNFGFVDAAGIGALFGVASGFEVSPTADESTEGASVRDSGIDPPLPRRAASPELAATVSKETVGGAPITGTHS
jgi:hypothetical protein